MARLARVIWNDIAYHVTQRGNARQTVFDSDHDRQVYMDLLRINCRCGKVRATLAIADHADCRSDSMLY